jgi:hypothetical protein
MRLFFVLVCCLAIPLVARAADQDNNKKKKQTTQGQQQQQQQTGKQGQQGNQGKRYNPNTAMQPNNPSQLKGQGPHRGLNAQNNNLPAVQSNTNGRVGTKHHGTNTASQLSSSSRSKGQGPHRGLNAQNNNLPALQSNTNGRVETRHFNLSNSPNPRIASAKFNPNYRIQGSQNWQGQNYGAFQNYRDQWHDQGWWHNHYDRIVLINGGWYFWNARYWYPAWGYDSAAAYYPYNGPIYAYTDV